MRKHGFARLFTIFAALAFVLGASAASAAQLRMSGQWLQRRGSVDIPLYIVALAGANGPVLGLGDPHIPGTGFLNATKAGTGPATFTVPPGVFQLQTARKVPLQAALSGLLGAGNGGNVVQVTTQFNLLGPGASGVFKQSATNARLAPNFAYCPGAANNPSCATAAVGGNDGTKPGLITYTAGPNRFGGTMQMLITGGGEVAVSLGGSPLRIRHDAIVGGSLAPQAQGGAYANTGSDVLQAADITTGATFTSMGLIGMVGTVTGMGTPDIDFNTGFPWTTGQVKVQVLGGVTSMNAPTTITMTGSDNRTANGRGTITMVAGGLSHRLTSGLTFGNLDMVSLDIASGQLTPALSPMGFVTLGSMLVLGGGYVLRRRF